MTRDEFESLLEEAFMMGYEDAMNEVFEEDSDFDLESEMDSYLESNAETKARNKEIAKRAFAKRRADSSDIAKYFYNKNGKIKQDSTGRYYQGGERGRLMERIRSNNYDMKKGALSGKDLLEYYKRNRYSPKNDNSKLPK